MGRSGWTNGVGLWTVGVLLAVSGAVSAEASNVKVVTVKGVIGPTVADYLVRNIEAANRATCQCVVIQLDTPGGLDDSMRKIVQAILHSDVPVVTYVSPEGAQAASAGTFIVMASHIAAMAPATNLGAATPVDMQGGSVSNKIVNNAAEYIVSLAQRRGRNKDWAEQAVRDGASLPAGEAVDAGVVDLVATGLVALLSTIDGRDVEVAGQNVKLRTADAQIVFQEMSWVQNLFQVLGHPNIAYILLMLGIWGLYFELANPGAILPGVIGGLCLILGMMALSVLPINFAGVLLIALSIILFIADLKTPTHGILTAGGVIAFALGSFMLFDASVGRVPWDLIGACTAATAAFFTFVLWLVVKAQRSRIIMGIERLVGMCGETQSNVDRDGVVLIEGEQWSAESASGAIAEGQRVEVVGVDGLTVKVRPVTADG